MSSAEHRDGEKLSLTESAVKKKNEKRPNVNKICDMTKLTKSQKWLIFAL